MRRKSRKLSAEDKAVWSRVAETLTPLRNTPPTVPLRVGSESDGSTSEGAPIRTDTAVFPSPRGPARQPGGSRLVLPPRVVPEEPSVRIDLAPDPMQAALDSAPAMDARAFGRLKRGKLAPEARIDLHGMTADRAHGALRGFIMDAHARGLRLVLVITGKGRGSDDGMPLSPARRGILRNAVPAWLGQPPLNMMVLQIAPAHQRHGGGGAYYVYLRKRRT